MKIKEKIKNISSRFISVKSRFLIPAVFVVFVSAVFIRCIIIDNFEEELTYLLLGCAAGFLASLLFSIFKSHDLVKVNELVNAVISIGLTAGCYFVLKTWIDNNYVVLGYIALIVFLIGFIVFVLYQDKYQDNLFGYLFSSAFYCAILCSVVFAGLSICILAFQFLIYEFNDMYKLYLILGVISEFTVSLLLMLSYIPDKNQEIEVPKSYTVIVNKVALIIYFVLITILYIYLGKIVITGDMPNGKINLFASFAILFFILFYMSCQSQKSALEKFFIRFGGLILIPVMAMQGYAIYIRLSAYGLTELRYLSLAFNLIGIIFIINSLFHYPLRFSVLASVVVCLVVLVGPFNLFDVPFRNQRNILYDLVERNNGQIINNEIVFNTNPQFSDKDKEIIRSTYDFLSSSDSKLENVVENIKDFEKTFGFPYYEYVDPYYNYTYVSYYKSSEMVDVSGYTAVSSYSVYYYDEIDDKQIEDFVWSLYHMYGTDGYQDQPMILKIDDKTDIYFTNISFDIYNDTDMKYVDLKGYVLYR